MPRCKEDGSYEDVQCSEQTGECWCVNSLGEEQRGTRSQEFVACPGLGKFIKNNITAVLKGSLNYSELLTKFCLSSFRFETGTDLTRCQQEYLQGSYKPLCTPEGSYEEIQCQGTACFCVNERGDEIAQSRTELPVKPNCTTAGKCKHLKVTYLIYRIPNCFILFYEPLLTDRMNHS